jgi:CRISPR-associated protein Csd1
MYATKPVRYIIELDADGNLLGARPIDTADTGDRGRRRGNLMAVPDIVRSSAVKPLLLADKADYVLGFVGSTDRPSRVAACHRAFVELTARCYAATGSPDVKAVLDFMSTVPLGGLDLPADFDPGATITFQVDGRFPVHDSGVQRFWADMNDPASRGGPIMQCIVCGSMRNVLARLPGKIKGVPGGQTAGTALVSANTPAFESYGLAANLVAPTCASCAEGFTRGLNGLLASEATSMRLGQGVFAFWTREPTAKFDFRRDVLDPTPESIRNLLATITTGGPRAGLEANAFYAVYLSASGGRAVVRDWIDTTVDHVIENAARWHRRQRVADPWSENHRPLGVFALAATTVREARDVAPPTTRALLRSAITGAPLPWTLLQQVVGRCRVEQTVDRPHAAMIKLVLATNGHFGEEDEQMVGLSQDHPSIAYQCGRLLAVLESAQRAALGEVGAGIVDRFYGTASTAPLTVFPRLLRGVQPHLGKLERDRPATAHALNDRLADVLVHIGAFPTTLSTAEQGLFALGYYHQRAWDRSRAREAGERRAAGSPPSDYVDETASS